jgi:hypothetical protein
MLTRVGRGPAESRAPLCGARFPRDLAENGLSTGCAATGFVRDSAPEAGRFRGSAQGVSDQDKISSHGSGNDRRRGGPNGSHGDTGLTARQQRARHQAARYRRKVEERLFGKKADRGRLRLEERLREADGQDNLLRSFREYVKSFGMPADVGLLLRLLDLENERDVLQVTDEIDRVADGLSPEQKSLLRSRLRNLEMSTSFDSVADAAATLLERL